MALVDAFASKGDALAAMKQLTGTSLSATQLRQLRLPQDAKEALLRGLEHPSPAVRYNCLALLDHLPDEEALAAVVPLLDDPVPRVRRIAVHALGCVACKPGADVALGADVLAKVAVMSANDVSARVRVEAARTLACRAPG